MNINALAGQVITTHHTLVNKTQKTINQYFTIRNWLVGYYIVEYEQNSEDRAAYGEKIIPTLAKKISQQSIKGFSKTNLLLFRQFYKTYPQFETYIREQVLLLPQLKGILPPTSIYQAVPDKSKTPIYQAVPDKLQIPANKALEQLSFTHFLELIKIDDPLKRAFYEIETIRGTWTTRQLKRQIGSLLFERTGLSNNKTKLLEITHQQTNEYQAQDILRNPMCLEFLNLPSNHLFTESELEQAILQHLQQFLLELGKGFCFVGSQYRMNIGGEYYYADLVFYHRFLRRHIII